MNQSAAIIWTMVLESFVAIVGVAGLVVLCREFVRRREPLFLSFAAGSLMTGLGFGLFLVAQWALAKSSLTLSATYYAAAIAFLTLSLFLLADGVSRSIGGSWSGRRSLAIWAAFSALMLLSFVGPFAGFGLPMPGMVSGAGGWNMGPMAVFGGFLAFFVFMAAFLSRHLEEGIRRHFGAAAACLAATTFFGVMNGMNGSLWWISAACLAVMFLLAFLILAALALRNGNPEIRRRPVLLAFRSLSFKAIAFNVTVFLAFSLMAAAVIVSFVLKSEMRERRILATNEAAFLSVCVSPALGEGGLLHSPDICRRLSVQPILSGYGVIDAFGVPVLESGDALPVRVSPVPFVSADDVLRVLGESGGMAAIEPVIGADGQAIGFAYSHLNQADIQALAVRTSAAAIILVLVALAAVSTILTIRLSLLVRPIREMRQAAVRVVAGDYAAAACCPGQDDMGQLVADFNQMVRTIGDQRERLRRQLAEQADFLVHTANEMRTPVNVFSWTVDMLRFGDVGRLERPQQELVQQLHQTTSRLSSLIKNLQDAAEIDRSALALRTEAFSLPEVIDEVAADFVVKAKEKGIDLIWERPPAGILSAIGDRRRTRQVVDNLVSNAVKYSGRDGRVSLSVAVAASRFPGGPKGQFLEMTVRDRGIGIPLNEHDRVFSRFFRSGSRANAEAGGAGLGLHISRRLVEMQGGSIWFESEEGEGSIFYFTVPAGNPNSSEPDAGLA